MFQTQSQVQITKRVVFCAAHRIPGAGKCERNHGHNWVANISVTQVQGELDPQGFIVDVRDLKDAAFKYDHDDLNNYFEIPSTENIAQKIADDALDVCRTNNPEGVFIVNVHLIETENNTASASASNFSASLPNTVTVPLNEQKKRAYDAETAWQFAGSQAPPVSKAKFVKRGDKND